MKNLLTRSLSGIIYVSLIVGAILGGTPWFTALLTLFAILAVIEFENILDGGKPQGWAAWTARILDVVFAATVLNTYTILRYAEGLLLPALILILLYTVIRFSLALYDKGQKAFEATAMSALAMLYIVLPLLLLFLTYTDRGYDSKMVVLVTFIMIWLNDTGAYCVGTLLGKHRLFERLSPKKSWEGFFGGLACCIGAGIAAYYCVPGIWPSIWIWMAFGVTVCALSTWGDLFESMMKRSKHIKDSGHLIPGHGGILDRIDSLLFVSVGLFVFFTFIR